MNWLKQLMLNSSWASPTIISNEVMFWAYCVLTLVIELGVFATYALLTDKNVKESAKIFAVLLVANLCSFLVGFVVTFMASTLIGFLIIGLILVSASLPLFIYITKKSEKQQNGE